MVDHPPVHPEEPPEDSPSTLFAAGKIAPAVIVLCAITLVVLLKTPGIILSILLVGLGAFIMLSRPNTAETDALITSLDLSAQDIRDVIEGHQVFLHGTGAKVLADRTLYRPELANADSDVEEISEFY